MDLGVHNSTKDYVERDLKIIEDKELYDLFISDIFGRVKYDVICSVHRVDDFAIGWRDEKLTGIDCVKHYYEFDFGGIYLKEIYKIKPYLRPMSTITEDERKQLKEATCPNGTGTFNDKYLLCPMNHYGEFISYNFMFNILNWLNAHHFDYNDLIGKGLALAAPEGMYK